jgi:purine-binding chemotaxis protein CheW
MKDSSKKKHMCFVVDKGRYAVQLSSVREVVGLPAVTSLPGQADGLRGLINLRGQVIPIFDLATRLRVGQAVRNGAKIEGDGDRAKPTVIITELDGLSAGLIVDDVQEVFGVTPTEIDRTVETITSLNQIGIAGAIKTVNSGLVVLLDLEAVLAPLRPTLQAAHQPAGTSEAA